MPFAPEPYLNTGGYLVGNSGVQSWQSIAGTPNAYKDIASNEMKFIYIYWKNQMNLKSRRPRDDAISTTKLDNVL